MRGKSRINKTWRLLYVYLFGNFPIDKGIMYIKLINLSTMWNHNGENQSNNHLFNDKTKILRIINKFLLNKTSSNQLSLITLNATIYTTLYLVHLTITNNFH
jgi:hypothetical protein